MQFPVADLRKGLALSSCGIRIDEYDDVTARLEWRGQKLRITRSDDIASTQVELVGEVATDATLPNVEQLQLPMDVQQALANPLPRLPYEEDEFGVPTSLPASPPGVHVDALLLSKILAVSQASETISITSQGNTQRIDTDTGSYYSLVPPPYSKLHTPQSLPFTAATLYEVGDATKTTAPFAGDPKKLLDCFILTLYGGKAWLGRSTSHDCMAAYELVGDPPKLDNDQVDHVLLRSELARLFSRLDEFTPWTLSLSVHIQQPWAHHEIKIEGWDVRSTTPLHRTLADRPGNIAEWMDATPDFEFDVPIEETVRACEAAKLIAGYAPPTAATRDTSEIAVPYDGATEEKPKAKKYITLGLDENSDGLVISGHGWRYDRTAARVPYMRHPNWDDIRNWLRMDSGEITVPADLLLAAVSSADVERDSSLTFSGRYIGTTGAVTVSTGRAFFVLPTSPEIASD